MEKLLSIIIPTYNMEALLPRCLDSLIVKENLDALEVWVVNDGSKDRSSEIGHEYESKYPGVISVIDKPNGNYGSCINVALPRCTGKYVKVLDSDDYFNTDDLCVLLPKLTESEADAVLTNYTTHNNKGAHLGKFGYQDGQILDLDKDVPCMFPMHAIIYRTEMLIANNYTQTEGISYTDTEWIFYPMLYARHLQYFDVNVYQYMLGREGQTVDFNVVLKNYKVLYRICNRMIETLSTADLSEAKKQYAHRGLARQVKNVHRFELVFNDDKAYDEVALSQLDMQLRQYSMEFYKSFEHDPFNPVQTIKYYHKTGKRFPTILRTIAKYVWYVKLFLTSFRPKN